MDAMLKVNMWNPIVSTGQINKTNPKPPCQEQVKKSDSMTVKPIENDLVKNPVQRIDVIHSSKKIQLSITKLDNGVSFCRTHVQNKPIIKQDARIGNSAGSRKSKDSEVPMSDDFDVGSAKRKPSLNDAFAEKMGRPTKFEQKLQLPMSQCKILESLPVIETVLAKGSSRKSSLEKVEKSPALNSDKTIEKTPETMPQLSVDSHSVSFDVPVTDKDENELKLPSCTSTPRRKSSSKEKDNSEEQKVIAAKGSKTSTPRLVKTNDNDAQSKSKALLLGTENLLNDPKQAKHAIELLKGIKINLEKNKTIQENRSESSRKKHEKEKTTLNKKVIMEEKTPAVASGVLHFFSPTVCFTVSLLPPLDIEPEYNNIIIFKCPNTCDHLRFVILA